MVAARAYEEDPDAVGRLIKALIDDLIYLTSEVWIVLGMLTDDQQNRPPDAPSRGSNAAQRNR